MSEPSALVPSIRISASGLEAENLRMEVAANNAANAHTTRGADGKMFRRREVVFATQLDNALAARGGDRGLHGVRVARIAEDTRPPTLVYKPGHPDADADGYVAMPNVSAVEEMINMMSASRAYEANLAAIKSATDMAKRALEIGK
jgi:flagellar basal-body rod protein FlgC